MLSKASTRPVMERIDIKKLEGYLKSEFENNGLNLPFQFAIYNKNEKILYSSNQYDPKIEGNLFTQAIFPNDPPARINYLKVYFPTKRNYISSSVKFMIPSFAFTFILLVTFLFTIIVAFRQKKLTEMRNNITIGDEIVTIGGIMGKVVQVTEDTITFETGEDRVRMQVTKWAISSNVREEKQRAAQEAAAKAAKSKKNAAKTSGEENKIDEGKGE